MGTRLSSASKQKLDSSGEIRRRLLCDSEWHFTWVPGRIQEGGVLCMLGCVQRNFAFDYVVQSRRALGFRRRPVCSKPGWRIGCADWVRNAAPSVVSSRRGLFGDVQIMDSLG